MEYLAQLIFSEKGFRIFGILVGVFLLRFFLRKITRRLIQVISDNKTNGKRLRTLTSIFNTTFSVVIILVGVFMVLKEAGFDITPLLASAGIVGLAVGFGAQTLVKDIISGFFLILEGQFNEGDKVEINGKKGVVEKISLRTISLRGEKKELYIIPNGSITLVTNYTQN